MPALARFLLLELVILPFRPRRSALAYQKIWGPEGSPLLVHGRALASSRRRRAGAGLRGRARHALRRARDPRGAREARRPRARAADRPALVSAVLDRRDRLGAREARARARAHRRPAAARDARRLLRRARLHRTPSPRSRASGSRPSRPDFVLFSYHGLPERQITQARRHGRDTASQRRPAATPSAPRTATATARSASPPRARWRASSGSRASASRARSNPGSDARRGSSPTPICCCRSSPRAATGAWPSSAPPSSPIVWRRSRRSRSARASSGARSAARSCC